MIFSWLSKAGPKAHGMEGLSPVFHEPHLPYTGDSCEVFPVVWAGNGHLADAGIRKSAIRVTPFRICT